MPATRSRRLRRPAVVVRALDHSLNRSLDRSSALLLLVAAGAMLAVILLVLIVTPARANESRTLTGAYPVGGAKRVELNFPFGDIRVEGADGSQVRVRVDASCDGDDKCERFLSSLKLDGTNRGGTLRVELDAPDSGGRFNLSDDGDRDDDDDKCWMRSWGRDRSDHRNRGDGDHGLTIVIQVPRALDVLVQVGAGELKIDGLREDLSINLGAGEIDVRMPARSVGSVDVAMAIGETVIHEGGKTHEYSRVLGGPIRWRQGKGDAGIDVNLGAGAVEVTLE